MKLHHEKQCAAGTPIMAGKQAVQTKGVIWRWLPEKNDCEGYTCQVKGMQDKSERAFKVNLTKSHLLVGDQVDTCEGLSKVILEGEKVKVPVNTSVDVNGQAGEFLSKTLLEGNVQEIRNLQLSFKKEIDSCLGLIKTGWMMYGAHLKRGSENVITKMDPGLGSLLVQPNKRFRKT
jgi:hypothetical protein